MNPSLSGPIAAGAADPARSLPRQGRIIIPAAALAVAGLAASAFYFAGWNGEPAPQMAAAASVVEAKPAQEPVVPAQTVEAQPAAPTAPQIITAELEPTQERASRIVQVAPVESAPAPVQANTPALLSDSDPRWGSASAAVEPVEAAELRSQLEELKRPAEAAPLAELAKATDTDAEVATTGAIAAAAYAAPEPAAVPSEPRPDIIAAAPAQEADVTAAVAAPAQQSAAPANVRTGRINTFVNMRSGPQNEASVLTVVPSGAEVGVIGGCKHWCQVTYDGRRGYVYKSFISGS